MQISTANMQYLVEGILFGLTLTILLGPIFIVLVQSSLEKGARAGLLAGTGIWTSDIIIVVACLLFLKRLSPYVQSKGFVFWVGLVGGFVLIVTGMVIIMKKPRLEFDSKNFSASNVLDYWVRGFVVNTFNPFTFVFWISVISSFIVTRGLNNTEATIFLGSIIATIVITDSLKVVLAKLIRNRITETILGRINKIAGTALIIFGFVLLLRSVI